jgi:DNA-binding transcriptional LysR family regulator
MIYFRGAAMDERDFGLLITLNETQNITHAADRLYISQSSLSKRILAIEKELGICLLLRSKQGVHFTPEGEEVLLRSKEAAYQLKLMRDNLNAKRDYVCGTLKAGVSINYALYTLPDVLAAYRKKYPHVNTHITTDQSRKLYLKIVDGTIDVAILRGEYEWNSNKLLLSREKICAIYSQKDKDRSLHDIPFIGRKTDMEFERELTQWLHENGFQTKNYGIYVDNITTCVEMVRRGLGWAIVPEICLKDFDGCIKPLFFANGEPLVRSTYILYSENISMLPQVKAFIDLVKNS